MGNTTDEGKDAKTETSSPLPAPEATSYHIYPDWAALQAFYGHQLALPPYYNSAVASSPATSPYMWPSPQPIPYGAPYAAAFYAHYAHPGAPLVGTAPSSESPVKSSGISDGGFAKKHKELDELAMSVGNKSVDNHDCGTESQLSDSEATIGSSGGSNGILPRVAKAGRKRSLPGSPNGVKELGGSGVALDLKNVKPNSSNASQQVASENLNEGELKRERRKQSNRESARRSRLRKQAETEELATKVQALTSDNSKLKSQISKMMESSARLKLENSALMDKLKDARLRETDHDPTVNLLERVNNADTGGGGVEDGDNENEVRGACESRSLPAKLHQLLDATPRTDAVAAR